MKLFPSRIFIDGGDPQETRQADAMLKKAGYHGLDGQTTNPTLIAKRAAQEGVSFKSQFHKKDTPSRVSEKEAFDFYKKTVQEMSRIIPKGEISIQVIGDPTTLTMEEMLTQARDRIRWIQNAVIKFPLTKNGLAAAEVFCQEGPVNITLNFSQQQAAAVYAATKTHNYPVYISPFVGRLDDKGQNGMDVVANELEMYRGLSDGHVSVLTASVRNLKHMEYALWLKSPVITTPFNVFQEWADKGFPIPEKDYIYDPPSPKGFGEASVPGLSEIPYQELTLDKDWKDYDLHHDLTDAGLAKFWEDWKNIVE